MPQPDVLHRSDLHVVGYRDGHTAKACGSDMEAVMLELEVAVLPGSQAERAAHDP